MAKVDDIIDATIGKEGDYSYHPSDLGGPTRWGVTLAVARDQGYSGDMRVLPRETAFIIFKKEYFIKPGFGQVAKINERVAEELFDTGVNQGVYYAACFLQTCLNAYNRQQKDYADVTVDGKIGDKTIKALAAFFQRRGAQAEIALLKGLNVLQGARYFTISEARPANEDFTFGWIMNRVELPHV